MPESVDNESRTEKSMLQVYLVRHGETQWNAERRIQGQSDSPLTAHGERQAWQVASAPERWGSPISLPAIWGEPAAQQKLSPKPAAAA